MEQALLSLWVSRTQYGFAAQQTVGLGESSFPLQTLCACQGFVHPWQGQENRKAAGSVQPLVSSITDNAKRGRPGSWLLKVPRSTGEHPRSPAQEGVTPRGLRGSGHRFRLKGTAELGVLSMACTHFHPPETECVGPGLG